MTPAALIQTAALLGLFALAGGGYGGCYSIGRLRGNASLVRIGAACWVVVAILALAITFLTPLDVGWKLLVLVSAAVYAVVPPMTWRYLERLHAAQHSEEIPGP